MHTFLIMVFIILLADFYKTEVEVKLYKLENCQSAKNLTIMFKFENLITTNNKMLMNYTSYVKEDVTNPISIVVYSKKCLFKDNLDTCEDMPVLQYNRFCENVKKPNILLKEIIYKTTPFIDCPIRKGTYKTVNATFDINALLAYQTKTYFWVTRSEIIEKSTKKLLFCLFTKAQVIFK
ncbi:uncharacterized protein LOC108735222 [Agrilus planipennis]|uniref:Uncharacterized protein LOC108735222 n=1 Tax=Agrilus planipennis TaxID=224129 RepID=A0A1W4WF32_AGRPL|nr:uncharacterized protein LOC108735222 [Agrilus planipennis]